MKSEINTFLRWIKIYYYHIGTAINTIFWARKHKFKITFGLIMSLLSWVNYKTFRQWPRITNSCQ